MSGTAEPLTQDIDRDTEAIKCTCKGYAGRVDCTDDEIREHDCGRGHECCARAFVCELCGKRFAGSAPAPDME